MKRSIAWTMAIAGLGYGHTSIAVVLGVTEGVTYHATDREIEERFAPIAEEIGKQIHQPITIRVLSDYKAMREALARQQIDFAYVHPSHVALQAIKTGKYRDAAWTTGYTDYTVTLLCKAGSVQGWGNLAGRTVVIPDPDSITAVVARAMLTTNGIQPTQVKFQSTQYQDAVPFYVENGFTEYGATASKGVIRDWKKKGFSICAEASPLPIKYWLYSSQLDPTLGFQFSQALTGLDRTEAGRRALAPSGYTGFVSPIEGSDENLIKRLGL